MLGEKLRCVYAVLSLLALRATGEDRDSNWLRKRSDTNGR
jgi:hypothetical protein